MLFLHALCNCARCAFCALSTCKGMDMILRLAHDQVQSNLVNTTLVYMAPLILRHCFARPNFLVQNSLFYVATTLDNVTFRISVFFLLKR